MPFKHTDLEIDKETPFKNCKLDREKYAKVLTQIVESHPEGFVLAINNKWGTGKTTFVRMWEQSLKNLEFKTIYFNAWENDFEDNPLTAFVGELSIVNKKANDKYNKVLQNAALISKNVIPGLLKAFVNKYLDSNVLSDMISESSKSILEIFEEDVKEYSKRKESIAKFRSSLSEFVVAGTNGKPLIFIIDELDRCRPNYSVLLLEQIKHFFSVPNIIFVLSIDKVQLGNAICGVYGSEKIDSNEYLRRFIDFEYSIPQPEKEIFVYYLYEYLGFDTFFNQPERRRYPEFTYDRDNFIETCKVLLGDLTLRQQEKIMSHARLALRTLQSNNYLLPTLFVFLSYIKLMNTSFYQNLVKKALSMKDIQDKFYELVKLWITSETKRLFVQIEGYLLKFYENYKSEYRGKSELLEENTDGKYSLKINSVIDDALLLNLLTTDKVAYSYADIKLSHLLNKLDFLDGIKFN